MDSGYAVLINSSYDLNEVKRVHPHATIILFKELSYKAHFMFLSTDLDSILDSLVLPLMPHSKLCCPNVSFYRDFYKERKDTRFVRKR